MKHHPPVSAFTALLAASLSLGLFSTTHATEAAASRAGTVQAEATSSLPATGAVTVGEFVVKLADAMRESATPVTTLSQARNLLALRGAVLPADLDLSAPLTQGAVARVASLLGLTVVSAEPESLLDPEIVDDVVGAVRVEADSARSLSGDVADAANAANAANADEEGPVSMLLAGKRALIGACCRPGQCGLTTLDKCQKKGGVFRGAGIPCGPDTCFENSGTCCAALGGPCTITVRENCDGRFRGTAICTNKTCTREAESPIVPAP